LEASHRLDDRLSEIDSTPGIQTVRDDISEKSFRDIEWESLGFNYSNVNPLRAAFTTYLFPNDDRAVCDIIRQRISHLEFFGRKCQKAGRSR